MKKYVALVLALCFLAVLPLTALAADTSYLPGTWNLTAVYETETEDYKSGDYSSTSKLTFESNGTAVFYLASEPMESKWVYEKTDDTGDWYTFTMNYSGTMLDLTMVVKEGCIYLLISDTVYIYSKA